MVFPHEMPRMPSASDLPDVPAVQDQYDVPKSPKPPKPPEPPKAPVRKRNNLTKGNYTKETKVMLSSSMSFKGKCHVI